MDGATESVHGTTIALPGRAALIRGRSGSGKSDLALRCLTMPGSPFCSAAVRLVADDQTILTRAGLSLIATAPEAIAGRLEVRGIGILKVERQQRAIIALIADLSSCESAERLPDPWPTATLLGLAVPLLRLRPFEASAAARLLAALSLPDLPKVVASD